MPDVLGRTIAAIFNYAMLDISIAIVEVFSILEPDPRFVTYVYIVTTLELAPGEGPSENHLYSGLCENLPK